jgi:hypothetical protein
MSDLRHKQLPADVEAALQALAEVQPETERARLLANTLSRTAAMLHRVARDQAAAKKGQKDWAAWAKLVNASRQAVLDAASCRDLTKGDANDG